MKLVDAVLVELFIEASASQIPKLATVLGSIVMAIVAVFVCVANVVTVVSSDSVETVVVVVAEEGTQVGPHIVEAALGRIVVTEVVLGDELVEETAEGVGVLTQGAIAELKRIFSEKLRRFLPVTPASKIWRSMTCRHLTI